MADPHDAHDSLDPRNTPDPRDSPDPRHVRLARRGQLDAHDGLDPHNAPNSRNTPDLRDMLDPQDVTRRASCGVRSVAEAVRRS